MEQLNLYEKDYESLTQLTILVDSLIRVQEDIKRYDLKLKTLKEKEKLTSECLIPELMQEYDIPNLTHAGYNISIQDIIAASIKSEKTILGSINENEERNKKNEALAYIVNSGGGSIIKKRIEVDIGKAPNEIVNDIKNYCISLGYEPFVEENVHNMTLKSFLKEKLEEGDNIPADALNLYLGKKAKLKIVK